MLLSAVHPNVEGDSGAKRKIPDMIVINKDNMCVDLLSKKNKMCVVDTLGSRFNTGEAAVCSNQPRQGL